jgi:hypothetical protein
MRFGFTSIRQAGTNAKIAASRFPLALMCGIAAAVAAMMLIEHGDDDIDRIRVLLTASLGLPLFVALETTRERRGWSGGARIGLLSGGVVALSLFWLLSAGWSDTLMVTRWVQLNVAFHLMVAFLPFAGFPTRHGFWQYNRTLFLRFLLAALYTGVLFAGLAIALVALDNLFGIDIDGEAYGHLWVLLAFVFDPWFFLGSLPRDIDALEERTDYPIGLKVFAQFVLIPVVTVYVLILTAYLVRVLVTRTWPSGWIGWLVSSVAAAGTLALLLVHPVRDREDSRWVDAYGRWFYVALLPSIGMLLMAIFQRLDQYGFTERRYFLLVLAFWLAGIALYYAVTASRNIRVIPVTLCVVALATLAGPWSAYAVSRNSQAARLDTLLTDNGMLLDGRIDRTPADAVPPEARREISATIRYLVTTHGAQSLSRVSPDLRLAAESADSIEEPLHSPEYVASVVVEEGLGLPYVTRYETIAQDWVNFYTMAFGRSIALEGYDILVRKELAGTDTTLVAVGGDTLSLWVTKAPATLHLLRRGEVASAVPLWPLIDEARAQTLAGPGPARVREGQAPLELRGEAAGVRYRILVPSLAGQGRGEDAQINSATADILLGVGR